MKNRFGRYEPKLKQALTNRHVLWLHAETAGEINICTHLVAALEQRLPNAKLVVSASSAAGMAELRAKLPSHISRIYAPLDRRPWVVRALSTINPEAIILIQARMWPNFLWRARQRGTPVFLVNPRFSTGQITRFRLLGFLFRRLFASFAGVGVQSESDAALVCKLGCRSGAVHVVGSLKYDAAKLEEHRRTDVPALLGKLGVNSGAPVLVCGSTHNGEESIIAEQFPRLRARFPDLFLVIAPRRVERSRQIGAELQKHGLRIVYRNEIMARSQFSPGEVDCLILNTTGELKHFYARGTVIFVGKSLTGQGGQNPIEPGAAGKPMVFGPNMRNFAEVADAFLRNNAALQVRDSAELENALVDLLSNEGRRAELGRNALGVVEENLGAIKRTVEMIIPHLDTELYVAPSGQRNY